MTTLNAINAATVNATVVKKPNTFCTRTKDECIVTKGSTAQLLCIPQDSDHVQCCVEGDMPFVAKSWMR